jgi:hypothetical protein
MMNPHILSSPSSGFIGSPYVLKFIGVIPKGIFGQGDYEDLSRAIDEEFDHLKGGRHLPC